MSVTGLLVLCFSTVFAQNLIFDKFLGTGLLLRASGKGNTALSLCGAVLFVMTASSAAVWALKSFVLSPLGFEYLEIMAFIAVAALFVKLFEAVTKKSFTLVTVNCAVLGTALLTAQKGHGFAESVLYGFFASLGFAAAMFTFNGVRKRLELATPPESFKGVPLYLVAAGLIAMVFAGFKGISFGGGSLFPFALHG